MRITIHHCPRTLLVALLALSIASLSGSHNVLADEPPPGTTTRVWHTPIAEAPVANQLVVEATVMGAQLVAEVTLHYRHLGDKEYHSLRFERVSGEGPRYSVTLPAEQMTPGVLEYYIGSRTAGAAADAPEHLHFASSERPFAMIVAGDTETRWRKELLAIHYGNHSRLQVKTEYVDFGMRKNLDGSLVSDNYWHLEGDYTYRILGWAYSIRLGAGILRGQTFFLATGADGSITGVQVPNPSLCTEPDPQHFCRVGFTYGFAELRFRFGRSVRLDLRTTLGVGPEHFDGGAGAQLIVGNDPGTHFALGFDANSSIGTRGWMRLAWNTVPRVPMSFTLEVLNLPTNGPVAGRVYLTAGYRFHRHFSIEAMLGYATRGWQVGGVTTGGGVTAEF